MAGELTGETPGEIPSEAQVLDWMTSLSNWGRWGDDDQLGCLNLITPATRKQAAALVRDGVTVILDAVRSEEEERALREAVTAERIGSVADELLAPERLHLVLVGPIDEGMDQQVRDAVAEY